MLIIDKSSGLANGLRTAEAYFTTPEAVWLAHQGQYDIVFFIQGASPPSGLPHKEFHTRHIDLSRSEEDLFNDFSETTRYEVRRTLKENTVSSFALRTPTDSDILHFCEQYGLFRQEKGMDDDGGESQRFYIGNMRELTQQNAYVMTFCRIGADAPLAFHSYIFDGIRARLHLSLSFFRGKDNKFRQQVSRANRSLIWSDMRYFKALGTKIYDVGGVSDDLPSIKEFKEGFGGVPVTEYHFHQGLTPKGVDALPHL